MDPSFDDPMHAYHAALIVNALLMSLAAVPAYFLARMFVAERASVLVAAATVLVPSMSYTGFVLTENACYPAFVLALLLIARALGSPSLANQAVALLGLGLVSLTRIQGLALAGAYLAAAATYAATSSREDRRRYLRRFLPTAVLTVVVSLLPMLLSIARGDGAFGWLGARSTTFDELHLAEVPQWFVFLVAGLVLYVAVIPLAATAVLCGLGLRRGATERVRLFAAVGLPTLLVMLASVAFVSASIDVDGRENLNERYLFYVVPLLFVGLALWVEEGLPRPRPWVWGVVVVPAALVLTLPIDRLVYHSGLQSTALASVGRLAHLGGGARGRGRGVRARLRLPVAAVPQLGGGTTLGRGARRHARRRRCRPVDPRRRRLERVEALRGAPSELGRRIRSRPAQTSSCSGISASPRGDVKDSALLVADGDRALQQQHRPGDEDRAQDVLRALPADRPCPPPTGLDARRP